YLNQEVKAALNETESGLKDLDKQMREPLAVAVLLSDLQHWKERLQSAKATWERAKKLSDSGPDLVAPGVLTLLGALEQQREADGQHYLLAEQLDTIRVEAGTHVEKSELNPAAAGLKYHELFAGPKLKLAPKSEPPEELAERVRKSPLRYVL